MPTRRIDAFDLTGQRWWARLVPLRGVADLAAKPWMDGFVSMALAAALCVTALALAPTFGAAGDTDLILREVAEQGLLAIGLTLVIVGGGIDLSIGSVTGVAAMTSLVLFRVFGLPVPMVVVAVLVLGAALGSVNGTLIVRLNTRPFITTLITLLAFRTVVQWLQTRYSSDLVQRRSDDLWSFLGQGSVAGIRTSVVIFAAVLVTAHLGLSRSRWGWWLTATGSDRRSARRNGIPVARVQFASYSIVGLLAGLSGLLLAARQGSTSDQVASGYEFVALTAVVVGGVSLKGGRGSVLRASIGMVVVAVIGRVVVIHRLDSAWNTVVLASVLLTFALLDLKWGKYRASFADKISLNPSSLAVGPLRDLEAPGGVWSLNAELAKAVPIGVGRIEGAEDCILDRDGNLYCGDRRGWIWRFDGPDHANGRVFARTGGLPLGHCWDPNGDLIVAVGGLGLARITPDGTTRTFANRTKRRWRSIHDDAAVRFADDLDIAADGSIYFSDFSTRTSASEWQREIVEYRPNGRVMRWDPRTDEVDTMIANYVFPNGVCVAHGGDSILIASTGLFRVDRLFITGPQAGQMEPVLENLPGLPDNINRASDGNYWLAFAGTRTPMSDLLLRHGSLRRRMVKELPVDDWVVPQLNVSCVAKFTDTGEVVKVLWDRDRQHHPMVTSMREHDGFLYLSGLQNNRIGRLPLDPTELGPIDPAVVPGTRELETARPGLTTAPSSPVAGPTRLAEGGAIRR